MVHLRINIASRLDLPLWKCSYSKSTTFICLKQATAITPIRLSS